MAAIPIYAHIWLSAPLGSKFYPFQGDFQMDLGVQESQQDITQVVSLVKNGVCVSLLFFVVFGSDIILGDRMGKSPVFYGAMNQIT